MRSLQLRRLFPSLSGIWVEIYLELVYPKAVVILPYKSSRYLSIISLLNLLTGPICFSNIRSQISRHSCAIHFKSGSLLPEVWYTAHLNSNLLPSLSPPTPGWIWHILVPPKFKFMYDAN